MNKRLLGAMAAFILASTGCSSSEPPPEHETMKVDDTVFAPTVQSLDKARGVQDTLEQGKERNDAALQDAQ